MSIRYHPPPSLGSRAGLGVFALSLVVLVWTAVQTWRVAPLPGPEDAERVRAVEDPVEAKRELLWAALKAVERDPFHPARRAPDRRYVLFDDPEGSPFAPEARATEVVLLLLGTAVAEGGGFAMCQLGSDPPRIARIGETVGGYTLRSVARGAARFTREDGSPITLTVPGSPDGSSGATRDTEGVHP